MGAENYCELTDIPPFLFVFDDESIWTRGFAQFLRKEGFMVHSTAKRKRALDLISKNQYDGYLVDIETDWDSTFGFKLIKKARAKSPSSYIKIVSAHRKYEERVDELGADGFTEKPIDDYNLLASEIREQVCIKYNDIIREKTGISDSEIENLDLFIHETAKILDKNKEVRTILLDIFGKEIPHIKDRIVELESLSKISNRILKRSSNIITHATKMIKDV